MEHSSFVAIHECGFYIWHCLHWDDSMDLNTTGIESIIKKNVSLNLKLRHVMKTRSHKRILGTIYLSHM